MREVAMGLFVVGLISGIISCVIFEIITKE